MNTNNTLEHAVIALKAGHKTEARGLLAQVIQQDPENAQAWLYLAAAVDTTAQRRTCLERVLALDPHHAVAQRALARLTAQAETQKGQELNPMSSVSDLALPSVPSPTTTPPSQHVRKPLRVGGLSILALIFILVVAVGFAVSTARQPEVAPLYTEPYVIIYGRVDCGLTRAMAEDLFEAGIPYQFKSIDDPGVGDEIYPRMRAAGLDTSYFLLPVIDVNGHILLEAKVKDIARYYEQP